jgi:uncharacterized protein
MLEQTQMTTLISQYQRLCQYCDDLFAATLQAFRTHMCCAPGCATCCVLETVTPLEADIIAGYLASHPLAPLAELSAGNKPEPGLCVFLEDNRCSIYPVRPIICRTHGMPLRYPAQPGIDACPLNFTEFNLSTLAPQDVLDTERITHNLMRLNLAYCLLRQQPEAAAKRIPLRQLRG